jgi:hypothetical protein
MSIARLRLQAEGRAELRDQADLIERVSPVSRQANMREMMQNPHERIALALAQAQLIQNSLQNQYNRRAQKAPYRMAKLNLRLEKAINKLQVRSAKASLTNTFIPDYASILQPALTALTDSIGTPNIPRDPASSGDNPAVGGDYTSQGAANSYDYSKVVGTNTVSSS